MSTTAKEKILHAASILFYNKGIEATGINSITNKANVAKMSLYNNFSTKNDLIASYITIRHQEWLDLYAIQENRAKTSLDKILAIFDAYQDHAEFNYENGFRGCGLLNAAAEFPANSPHRVAVKKHKEEVESIIKQHLSHLTQDQHKINELALMVSFLLEGSISRAGLEGSSHKVTAAKVLTKKILEKEAINEK